MSGPKQSSVNSSNSKSKVVERIAFDPYLPQQDLINEFIRNTISPDIDFGQTYYLGKVIDIISSDNKEIDVRDVFYSPSDNYERATKAVSDKKFNIKRKVLLVHIPSFLTNANSSTEKKLNYSSFTKIRVDYDGKDPVEIGNLVRIQFRDKNSFYDPYVIGIENINKDYIDQVEPAIKKFKEYQNCKITNIVFANTVGGISTNVNSTPAGGYSLAFEEINNIFSAHYIEAFKQTITQTEFGDLAKILIKATEISTSSDVYVNTPLSQEYTYKVVVDDTIEKKYLIIGKNIIISCEKPEKNNTLRNKFYNYVKADLESRFNYTFSYENNDTNEFNLDINLNFLVNENKKTVDQYINISNMFGDSPAIVNKINPGKSTDKTSSSQIAGSASVIDKCDAEIAKDKTTYQLVYEDGKITKNAEVSDKVILEQLYLGKINTKNYIQPDYFYKLVEKNEQQLLKINSSFYVQSGQTNDLYNLKKDQKNILNINDIKTNFYKVSSFLLRLKNQIEIIEQYNIDSNEVLVLPIQVLKVKQKLNPSGKVDKNSRHYYGKAFDIRVYLKTDKKIVQIPPEIVSLYADLEVVKENTFIGQGIFLDGKKRYNHIEFLENKEKMNLPLNEWLQRAMYTGNSDDIEKAIESSPVGQPRINKLKEIVRLGSSYINPTTKNLDPRFAYLIGER